LQAILPAPSSNEKLKVPARWHKQRATGIEHPASSIRALLSAIRHTLSAIFLPVILSAAKNLLLSFVFWTFEFVRSP